MAVSIRQPDRMAVVHTEPDQNVILSTSDAREAPGAVELVRQERGYHIVARGGESPNRPAADDADRRRWRGRAESVQSELSFFSESPESESALSFDFAFRSFRRSLSRILASSWRALRFPGRSR